MSRLDYLEPLGRTLEQLVGELAARQVRILHKAFNYTTREIQAGSINSLSKAFPKYFTSYQKLDKGLTSDLLEQCWLVLWDEPGTGFFECLIAGIPTLVYWGRLTSGEEPYASDIFGELEEVGLAHRTPQTLAEEVATFLESPEAWRNDRRRLNAITNAVDRFASVDTAWASRWKATIAHWRSTNKLINLSR